MDLIAICLSSAFQWSHQREINRLCVTSINMNKHFGNCTLKRQIFEVPHFKVCRLLCRFDFLSQLMPIYFITSACQGGKVHFSFVNYAHLAVISNCAIYLGSDRRAR